MIELPEAVTIARQIDADLKGKVVMTGVRGNSPHKFAFYTLSPEDYAAILPGKTIAGAAVNGPLILVDLDPGHLLGLGGGGERILFHETDVTLPKKHQLLLGFTDGTYLSVTVQGWGSALLLQKSQNHPFIDTGRISPLSDAFTLEHFLGLFSGLAERDSRSCKFFMISEPRVLGVGNGYLQDILFRARVHPRRRAVDLTDQERRALYEATRAVLQQAVELGGRDSERDLHDRPGGYKRILDSTKVGKPCPVCETPIEKTMFLGGAAYFCPSCQV